MRTLYGKGGGGLQMRTSALFGAKNVGFSEIYGVSARTRGEGRLSQFGHFTDKECQFFAIFCGRPLWTAPYNNKGINNMLTSIRPGGIETLISFVAKLPPKDIFHFTRLILPEL